MDIEDLVSPGRVTLDEEGRELYSLMIDSEQHFVTTLESTGCAVWHRAAGRIDALPEGSPVFLPGAWALSSSRRWVILAPTHRAVQIRDVWNSGIADLNGPRQRFLEYLRAHSDERTVGAGMHSTSMPKWVGYGRACDRATYSVAKAFRSGHIDDPGIDQLLSRRISETRQYIENAERHHQHARRDEYEQRLAQLSADLAAVQIHRAAGIPLIARVSSGHGVRVRFRWARGDSTQVSLQHIVVATAVPDCQLEMAPSRDRESKYGVPLEILANGALWVYADPRYQLPDPGSTSL